MTVNVDGRSMTVTITADVLEDVTMVEKRYNGQVTVELNVDGRYMEVTMDGRIDKDVFVEVI